ncbi:MAG: hypothetical protein KC729_18505 [Candidatus Eisenbacteria bacterium]|uniref:Uncharacterized protein n=1 Tax=Eiseniibacteriota bacterium TaxID=2212470 RepID=A0A956M457_UNCEI|nr:hypothetical protein [Candidatus Eisenbacteria bacterium]
MSVELDSGPGIPDHPYNVMREPFTLVLLEGACWLVVLLFVGLALGLTHAAFDRGRSRLFPPHRLC